MLGGIKNIASQALLFALLYFFSKGDSGQWDCVELFRMRKV